MPVWDISLPLGPDTLCYPGEPAPALSVKALLERGDPFTSHRLALSCHAGMHVDTPAHFVPGGATVDMLAVDALCGPACVVDASDVTARCLTARDLAARADDMAAPIVLFRTQNSSRRLLRATAYTKDYTCLAPDAAGWLVDRGVRAVGIDYLSVEEDRAPGYPVHRTLLGSGVLILENCWLGEVKGGRYELVCLPLRLAGSEGAPVRAFLRAP